LIGGLASAVIMRPVDVKGAHGMPRIWQLGYNDGHNVTLSAQFLDGDIRKTEYVDRTKDVLSVGFSFKTGEKRLGRVLKPDNIPTKFRWGGSAARMPDVVLAYSVILVNDKVRDIVEALEPGIHQFFPLETLTRGDVPGPRMYLMNICNRLDSVDRAHTTRVLERGHSWKTNQNPETLVFSLAQIGEAQLWHDKHLFDTLLITDAVKEAFDSAKVTGFTYWPFPAV
jgi:hypothetical protein